MSFRDQILGYAYLALLKQGIADFVSLCFEECVCHAAADQHDIDHPDESLQHHYFVRDFGTANNCCERSPRVLQGRSQEVDLFFHQEACDTRQEVCDPFRRGMGTMRGSESIIDVHLTKRCELARKGCVVFLFCFMEAQIFQQQYLARTQSFCLCFNLWPDAISC